MTAIRSLAPLMPWAACLAGVLAGAAGCQGAPMDPCAGRGCASQPGSVTLHVLDGATSGSLAQPSFSANGQRLSFYCADARLADGGAAPCSAWRLDAEGHQVITISAPGHVPETVTIDIAPPQGCCGAGEQVERTVTLKAS